jgi:hypothetical protein
MTIRQNGTGENTNGRKMKSISRTALAGRVVETVRGQELSSMWRTNQEKTQQDIVPSRHVAGGGPFLVRLFGSFREFQSYNTASLLLAGILVSFSGSVHAES